MGEMKYRLIRIDDYVAELIETDAARMPLSMKEQADILRERAQRLRQSDEKGMVRIWNEEGADFTRPDPASH